MAPPWLRWYPGLEWHGHEGGCVYCTVRRRFTALAALYVHLVLGRRRKGKNRMGSRVMVMGGHISKSQKKELKGTHTGRHSNSCRHVDDVMNRWNWVGKQAEATRRNLCSDVVETHNANYRMKYEVAASKEALVPCSSSGSDSCSSAQLRYVQGSSSSCEV